VLGDIDAQTVAGATQTGTHGTGREVASLAAQVRALELVLPGGDLVTCTPADEPDLFEAARVGLGALGVVTAVHVATVPAFRLRGTTERQRLSAVAEDLGAFAASSDHSELFWLPRTDTVQLKRRDRVTAPPSARWRRAARALEVDVVENAGLAVLGAAHRAAPRAIGPANRVAAALVGRSEVVDASAAVFASPRRVRFVEMEYALPAGTGRAVLTELRQVLEAHETGFPVEVRFAPGDDVWLSPAWARDTVFVAVHTFRRSPDPAFLADAEAVMAAYGGRPHWGKVHSMSGAALDAAYPRLADWRAVRDRVDPERLLSSPYLRNLLGD
jgi:FAD/FMN-containing dehydrogenase